MSNRGEIMMLMINSYFNKSENDKNISELLEFLVYIHYILSSLLCHKKITSILVKN